jgi:PAS domain S-box-containing protein
MLDLEHIKSIFTHAPTAHVILNNDVGLFNIAWANPSFLSLANTGLEQLSGKSIFEILNNISQADSQRGNDGLRTTLANSIALKTLQKVGVQRFAKPDRLNAANELQLWTCSVYPLFDEQDQLLFLVLTLDDVTEKFSQLNPVTGLIRDTYSGYSLQRDDPDAIFTLSKDGMFLSANKVLLEILECNVEELTKLSFIPFMPPEHLEQIMKNFNRSITGEILNFDMEFVSSKGNRRSVNVTPVPIMSNQEVIGLYIVAKDLTAILKAQQELMDQRKQIEIYNQKMSDILESITDGFYAVERDWTVTYWNTEAEIILKRPRELIIGRSVWDVYPPESHVELFASLHKAMTARISTRLDLYYEPLLAWIEVTAFPLEEGLSVYLKDITIRKQTEQKLKEAKIQYQNLFDRSPLAQWVYGIDDHKFKDVNQAAIAQYGYSKEEFLSMSIKDVKLKEDIPELEEVLKEHNRNDHFLRTIGRHVKKNGEIIYAQVDANSIIYEGKAARLVLAVDVTDRLKAKQELVVSEQKFKALVQDGSDLLAILDNVGNFIYVNHTTTRILEIPEQGFLGKFAFDFVMEAHRDRVVSEFRALENKKTHKIAPYQFKNGKGQYVWIETTITNMIDDPAVAGVVFNSRDVTNRIETEQRIQQSIERYNIVSKATSDAIWDYDVTLGKVVWNDAVKKLFGYNEINYLPSWWEERLHPDDSLRVKAQIQLMTENKENRINTEYRFRCADGSYKNILDRSFLMFDEHGEVVRVIGSMQDITEREMYVQTVEKQNTRLKEIAWTQSHVVRAPLARIMGIADLLSDGGMDEVTNEELRSHLAVSAAELDDIIRNIITNTETIYNNSQ